jgi:rubrerythrin
MQGLKGTQTEMNLAAAFGGESEAAMRYGFFAKKAKKEGFELVAAVFERGALEEAAHASRFYKLLQGGVVSVPAGIHAGGNGSTADNLRESAVAEQEEWKTTYPAFAQTAREEGFEPIARILEGIAVAEKHHEWRYRGLLEHIEKGTLFRRETPVVWRCRKCGFLHEGLEAPDVCIACAHPQGYFEVLGESW